MLTRWRVTRALGAFLISILVILYVASRLFILSSFEDLERQVIHTQVARVNDALADRLAALSSKTGDWGTWDEAYDYVVGKNPEFVTTEITDATMAQLKINLILMVNNSGKTVYFRGFDLEKKREVPFRDVGTLRFEKFLEGLSPESQLAGLVLLSDTPMLIAARPIVTNEGKGPPHGAMVFGRYLDTVELDQLAKTTHLNVTLNRLDHELPTDELRAARAALSEQDPDFVQALDEQKIAGYALWNDIYGKPALMARVEQPREIYQQGWTSIRYFVVALSATILIFAVLALTLADRLIQAQRRERESEQLYYTLAEAAPDAIYVVDPDRRIKYANETAGRDFADRWNLILGLPDGPETILTPGDEIRTVLQTKQPMQIERGMKMSDRETWLDIKMVPLQNGNGEPNAVLGIARDITERRQSEEQVQRQVRRLGAVHAIDQAITSSVDLSLTLTLLLAETTAQLGVDAADVLLFDEISQSLDCAAGSGFQAGSSPRAKCNLSDGLAGRAVLERKSVLVQNLRAADQTVQGLETLIAEELVFGASTPLLARGRVRGVLEVFHRAPLHPDDEWLGFLGTLAGQAAIAVDSNEMFKDLQRSSAELTVAYDKTLEGWTHALELRERETGEHTRLVTELTVRLGRAMGVKDEELVQMRRGALLHDIGKMAIPDSILLKPGILTDAERKIMQKHPVYAYEMLSPIAYLRAALDIPYCHHESWDGTGYPRGLKKEEIPFAARVFAVVDTWDALRSDRPYRAAWQASQVIEYIREQSGKHFDPCVVEMFLQVVKEKQD